MKRKDFIYLLVAVLAIFATGFFAGRKNAGKTVIERIEKQVDTIVVFDTISVTQPVFTRVRVVDTMYVAATDTVVLNDTVFMALPREEKEYRGENYRAVVSGYRPQLDTLEQYLKEKIVPVYYKEAQPRNFVRLQGGIRYDKQPMMPVGLSIGYRKGVFEASAGGGYDFLTKSVFIDTELDIVLSWN